MPENTTTFTESNQLNGIQKQQATPKRSRRKQLPNPVQSSTSRAEIAIKATVSNTPKSVAADDFPLYRLFTLDASGCGELFIKITKHKIINVVSGDPFSSSTTGYLLSL